MQLPVEDDEGVQCTFIMPGSFYVPSAPSILLSPQHLSQCKKDNRGTWCATYGDKIILYWDKNTHKRTMHLDKKEGNVGTIHTAPSTNRYHAFCSQIDEDDDDPACYNATIVSDEEEQQEQEEE
jgi:hypothetical protein